MATRIITIDDWDGSEDDTVTTRTFMIDGTYYAIDLSDENHASLHKALMTYIPFSSHITRARSNTIAPEVSPGSNANKPDTAAEVNADTIREWARANGYPQVKDRGRVPGNIVEAYNAAMEAAASNIEEKK